MTFAVVGLDLALQATGVARRDGTPTLIRPGKVTGPERLARIEAAVLEHVAGDVLVAVEDYAMSRATAYAHALGELGGVVRLALWRAGVPYVNVGTSSLKVYATGKGNAAKELVLVEAVKRLGYAGADTNEADALWLRAMLLDANGSPVVQVPQTHRRALAAIPAPVERR